MKMKDTVKNCRKKKRVKNYRLAKFLKVHLSKPKLYSLVYERIFLLTYVSIVPEIIPPGFDLFFNYLIDKYCILVLISKLNACIK